MTGEQKPGGLEVAGHFYQTEPGQWTQMNEADGSTVSLTPAEPAEARVRELEAEVRDVSALREAIFRVILNEGGVMIAPGDEPDAIRRIIDRATAAEAQLAKAKDALEEIAGRPFLIQRQGRRRRCPSCSYAWDLDEGMKERHDRSCDRVRANIALAALQEAGEVG